MLLQPDLARHDRAPFYPKREFPLRILQLVHARRIFEPSLRVETARRTECGLYLLEAPLFGRVPADPTFKAWFSSCEFTSLLGFRRGASGGRAGAAVAAEEYSD